VDGEIVRDTPSVGVAAGRAKDVELVIGATIDEMRLFPDPRADALSADEMTRWLNLGLRTRMAAEPPDGAAAELLANYQQRHDGGARPTGSDIWSAIQTDGLMRLPIERIAEAQSEYAATYMYQFAWQPNHATRDVGAFHAIDLPFAFDSFDAASKTQTWGEFLGVDDDGRRLGRIIRSAWAAFAATGDPTTAATGPWAPYDARARTAMVFDTTSGAVNDPLGQERAWWEGLWHPDCVPAAVPL
jgi:para-nitrobenzyl esterase